MAGGRRSAAERAVDLAHRHPRRALAVAASAETSATNGRERTLAAWAGGLAERELGNLDGAEHLLHRALAHEESSPEPSLRSRILVSLALVRAFAGDHPGALALLSEAEPLAEGIDRGHVFMQRGVVQYWSGDIGAAVHSYEQALPVLHGHDPVAEARAHVNCGGALTFVGRLDEALDHLERGERLAVTARQTLIAATASHNRAHALALAGQLPAAFEAFDLAERRYGRASSSAEFRSVLRLDRAKALLSANLLSEALAAASRVRGTGDGQPTHTSAEAAYVASQVLIGMGEFDAALDQANHASSAFASLGRANWELLATALQIGLEALRHPAPQVIGDAIGLARRFDRLGQRLEASRLRVIAARTAAVLGDSSTADVLVRGLSGTSTPLTSLDRIAIEQVRAQLALDADRADRARRAVRRGLKIYSDHAIMLGAIELRARAAANAERLAGVGIELAVRDGRARELLEFVEAARAPALAGNSAGRHVAPELSKQMIELRRLVRELSDTEPGTARGELETQRLRVERRVARLARRSRSGNVTGATVREALHHLGPRDLLEFGVVDGRVVAVTVTRGRARLADIGPLPVIERLAGGIAHALHRLNRDGLSAGSRAAALTALEADGRELGELLIPRAIRNAAGPLFVVPSGALHGVAWNTLPQLTGRPVSVVPSLLAWASHHRDGDRVGSGRPPLFVQGPDLTGASGEVQRIAAAYEDALVLRRQDATSARVLEALALTDMVHFACHGTFRSDNPQFSTLRLDDGPLTVFDLEGAAALPGTAVLAACDAASNAVLAGGALLGLSSALVTLGVANLVAPLSPVSDERTVDVMVAFHTHLRAGRDVAEALARTVAEADEDHVPVAASFVAVRG